MFFERSKSFGEKLSIDKDLDEKLSLTAKSLASIKKMIHWLERRSRFDLNLSVKYKDNVLIANNSTKITVTPALYFIAAIKQTYNSIQIIDVTSLDPKNKERKNTFSKDINTRKL